MNFKCFKKLLKEAIAINGRHYRNSGPSHDLSLIALFRSLLCQAPTWQLFNKGKELSGLRFAVSYFTTLCISVCVLSTW